MAPGQGPHDRGREVLPYCCQNRSSTEHMKGIHSRFYGPRWLLKPLLWSEFMYPIARINNASLIRDPRHETPGGRGAGKRTECNVHHVSAALLRKSSSSRTFLLERIYFTSLSKMSLSIFSSVWGLLGFNQSSGLYTRKAYVTDMLLSSKI